MSDKLARARHTRPASPTRQPAPAHTRSATAAQADVPPGQTARIEIVGKHGGVDLTQQDNLARTASVRQRIKTTGGKGANAAADREGTFPRRGSHAGIDRTSRPDPSETSEIFVGGSHAGIDRTRPQDPFEPQTSKPAMPMGTSESFDEDDVVFGSVAQCAGDNRPIVAERPATQPASTTNVDTSEGSADVASVGASAALISICVMISRVTGFARTWAMAFALGSTLLSSSYQVANNLPNMLYELVAGGMLVTAFLPVYVSVKKRLGQNAGNDYASNLLTIVVLLLGIVAAFCMAFPSLVIYTQSFYSDQSQMAQSVFFFQFFAVQIVFYAGSAILSGLLNANRDYLWSSIAPVANNVIVIATFLAYAAVAPHDPNLALYIIAIGNPAGVFVQMAIQIPALRKNGIRLRPRINFRDPALRETVGIGVPALLVMVCSFAIVSVQNAASYNFADNGPSILAYSRLWFTLPYAFLAVPITTAMFTELSNMQAEGNLAGVKQGIVSGTNQILFFMIPFALYLAVFSLPLVTLYHAGAFTMESVTTIASYLAVLACALPFYGVNTYLQKVFSSLRHMGVFAAFNYVAAAVQIGGTMFAASGVGNLPIEAIAFAEMLFYIVADLCLFGYLRHKLGAFGIRSILRAALYGMLFGGVGAGVGYGALWALQTLVSPLGGSIPQALAYAAIAGVLALAATFLPAIALKIPEAQFVSAIAVKIKGKIARG